MKIGIIGNTKQTLKGIRSLVENGHEVVFVFGLPESLLREKVNAVDLTDICSQHNIYYTNTGDWTELLNQELDLVVALGDSRLVPTTVLEKFKTIGNHGAVLPYVQGGASLVWGRMLNSGQWGVSLMELGKEFDTGTILGTKTFLYNKSSCTMEEFSELADDTTIWLLMEYMAGRCISSTNSKWNVKVAKHTDSMTAVSVLEATLGAKQNIYLPSRTPDDALINPEWGTYLRGKSFVEVFKVANDHPYPKWR